MKETVEINLIEVACKLAEVRTEESCSGEILLYDKEEDATYYTDHAQDVFDRWYDFYYSVLINNDLNPDNTPDNVIDFKSFKDSKEVNCPVICQGDAA